MKTIRNCTPMVAALLVTIVTISSFSTEVQAEERSRWDVKSIPRLPSAEKLADEIRDYQLPHTPEQGKALVYVVRPSWLLGLVRFGVYVDGKDKVAKVGHNRARQYIYFNLEPGEHTIYSKASNWSEVTLNLEAGETIVLEQEQNAFVSNYLFQLSDDGGKYRIKKAKPGTILKKDG